MFCFSPTLIPVDRYVREPPAYEPDRLEVVNWIKLEVIQRRTIWDGIDR